MSGITNNQDERCYQTHRNMQIDGDIPVMHKQQFAQSNASARTIPFTVPCIVVGGERGLVVGRWTCIPEVPGSNPPPCL